MITKVLVSIVFLVIWFTFLLWIGRKAKEAGEEPKKVLFKDCPPHKWSYIEGGMQCGLCKFIAGSLKSDSGDYDA